MDELRWLEMRYWWTVLVCVLLSNGMLLWMVWAVLPRVLNVEQVLVWWMQERKAAKPPVEAGTIKVLSDQEVAQRERQLLADSRRRAQTTR